MTGLTHIGIKNARPLADFRCSNIQNKISAAVKNNLMKKKNESMQQAKYDRRYDKEKHFNKEEEKAIEHNLLLSYKNFYVQNENIFNETEKNKLKSFFKANKILQIGAIIEPLLKHS